VDKHCDEKSLIKFLASIRIDFDWGLEKRPLQSAILTSVAENLSFVVTSYR